MCGGCLRFVVCCLRGLLIVECRLWSVVCCLFVVGWCLAFVVCSWLRVVVCCLFERCGLLSVVCCLFAVC